MVWSGVASAVGSDPRHRDEGDAGAHRRGAVTPETAPRRRNRLRRQGFCPQRTKLWSTTRSGIKSILLAAVNCKSPDATPAPIFFSSLLVCDRRSGEPVSNARRPAARDAIDLLGLLQRSRRGLPAHDFRR